MKPQRLVMSMVPNKSYLEGYNAALDATEAHQKKVEALLLKVLNAGWPTRCNAVSEETEQSLRTEVAELLELG